MTIDEAIAKLTTYRALYGGRTRVVAVETDHLDGKTVVYDKDPNFDIANFRDHPHEAGRTATHLRVLRISA